MHQTDRLFYYQIFLTIMLWRGKPKQSFILYTGRLFFVYEKYCNFCTCIIYSIIVLELFTQYFIRPAPLLRLRIQYHLHFTRLDLNYRFSLFLSSRSKFQKGQSLQKINNLILQGLIKRVRRILVYLNLHCLKSDFQNQHYSCWPLIRVT